MRQAPLGASVWSEHVPLAAQPLPKTPVFVGSASRKGSRICFAYQSLALDNALFRQCKPRLKREAVNVPEKAFAKLQRRGPEMGTGDRIETIPS